MGLVLFATIAFGLAFTLITQREPDERLARFGNRAVGYVMQILRYFIHREGEPPFPFSEFPPDPDRDARAS